MRFPVSVVAPALMGFIITITGLVMAPAVQAEFGGPSQNAGSALDPAIEPYTNRNGLSGRLSIAGSDTMSPLISKLAAQFNHLHPAVDIAVEGIGSNSAIREFQLGISSQRRGDKLRGKGTEGSNRVELLASSRELTEDELKGIESHHGSRPVGIPIAMDAVAIYVNKDNPIQHLTLDQLDAIFGKERKRGHASIANWSQAGIMEGTLAQQPCHLYGRDRDSGTRAFFKHIALRDGELKDEVVEQPGSASEIIAIAQDPLGIGYAGVGFQISSVRTVPISPAPEQPALLPTQDNVLSGAYPLSRPLYLYVKFNPKAKLNPMVKEFLLFINSRQGQETVARANFYPLTGVQVAKNREALGLIQSSMAETNESTPQSFLAWLRQ